MKVLVLFDMKSEKVFVIVGSNCLKGRILFYFLVKCFLLYALGFHVCVFLKLFPATLPCLISGSKERHSSMVEFLWFI